jgi:hypothetical protein
MLDRARKGKDNLNRRIILMDTVVWIFIAIYGIYGVLAAIYEICQVRRESRKKHPEDFPFSN